MLVKALAHFEGTLLFVSHDRRFLSSLSNRVLELGPAGTEAVRRGYTEYVSARAKSTWATLTPWPRFWCESSKESRRSARHRAVDVRRFGQTVNDPKKDIARKLKVQRELFLSPSSRA